MPYARRSYKRKYTRRNTSNKRRKPSAAPPKRKNLRSYVRKNAYKNARQDRQIRNLWNRTYGKVQKNIQQTSQTLRISDVHPICFDAADFTSERTTSSGTTTATGARIWTTNNTITNLDQAGHWTTANFASNVFWQFQNQNIPDGGSYKPIACHYKIQWDVKCQPDKAPPHVYLHLFSQKAGFMRNNLAQVPGMSIENRVMPQALVHLTKMASIDENKLNSDFFRVYKIAKRVLVPNVAASDHGTGATATYQMSLTVRPKRERNQLAEDPTIPGTVNPEAGQTALGNYGVYNVDPRTPLWCMLSSSFAPSDPENFTQAKVMRTCVWRDVNGAARVF